MKVATGCTALRRSTPLRLAASSFVVEKKKKKTNHQSRVKDWDVVRGGGG